MGENLYYVILVISVSLLKYSLKYKGENSNNHN